LPRVLSGRISLFLYEVFETQPLLRSVIVASGNLKVHGVVSTSQRRWQQDCLPAKRSVSFAGFQKSSDRFEQLRRSQQPLHVVGKDWDSCVSPPHFLQIEHGQKNTMPTSKTLAVASLVRMEMRGQLLLVSSFRSFR